MTTKPNVIEFDYWMLSVLTKILGDLAHKKLSKYTEEYQEIVKKMTVEELKESKFRWGDHEVLLHRIFEKAYYDTDTLIEKLRRN